MSTGLISNFLKSKYDNGKIPRELIEEFPTISRVPKRSDGGGDYFISSVVIGNPMGRGPTLTVAQAGASQGSPYQDLKGKKWIVPWAPDSGSVYIEDFDIKRSRSNEVTFINWLDEQIDGIRRSVLERTSIQFFADPGYAVSVGIWNSSTHALTLNTASDIVKFQQGMICQANVVDGSDGTTAMTGSGALGYVIAVDASAGTVTFSATAGSSTAASPSGWDTAASGNTPTGTLYVFQDGDAPVLANVVMNSIGDWCPPVTTGLTTSFNNVVRSTWPTKLAGFRLTSSDVAGMSIRQRITRLVTIMMARGTTPGVTDIILNPEKWQVLVDELQAQGWRPLEGKGMVFNSNEIQVAIGGKMVSIVADRHCPYGWAYALTMPKDGSNIVMPSVDEFWHVIEEDGLMMLRSSTANTYEHRLQSYKCLLVKAPEWVGRVAV